MDEELKKIGEHWSNKAKEQKNSQLKLRWWQSSFIVKNINRRVSGKSVSGFSQGLIIRTKELLGDSLPLKRGISVGCGNGAKEIKLIRQDIVEVFDLFELSEQRIMDGVQLLRKYGLEDKVNFMQNNAFETVTEPEQYDIVHWNNSLHHMLDVNKAIEWSMRILKKGGLFYMDDFVGDSRFQWTEKQIEMASKIREILPRKYLANPKKPGTYLPTHIHRPNLKKLIATDPSEAADSENIIEAIGRYFPNAEIRKTGGVVYHLALSNIIHNFDESKERDMVLLKLLMMIDELYTELGETHYATALAIKES